jgi:hypothetical protein
MDRERTYKVSPELLVLCGELELSVHGTVVCGAELATVPDEDHEVIIGPQAVLVDNHRRSLAVAPCHGVAANNADLRFMYDDLEYRGVAWVRFDGTVRGTTSDSVVESQPFR